MNGKFITFEGIDSCGKSVQAEIASTRLTKIGVSNILIRDPGTTKISEQIRRIILDKNNKEMCHQTELFLFSAARAQMVFETILPALKKGITVICDRFYDSTTAYQGYGRNLDLPGVYKMNELASFGRIPDRTFVIDIDPSMAMNRQRASGKQPDRIESEKIEFIHRVRDGFLAIAKREPQRIIVVKGDNQIQSIASEIWEQIVRLLKKS